MKLKIVTAVAALAFVGAAASGCVETGPGYGGGYHHTDRVVVQHDRRVVVTPDNHHDRNDHRGGRHDNDHHDSRYDRDHHDSHHDRVDCRRDPRNPACRGHH